MEYTKFQSEDGKYFGLAWTGGSYDVSSDGDLGRGSGQCTMRFFSEEGREIFIQKKEVERLLTLAHRELRYLKAQIAACLTKTGRVRSKKVARLAAEVAKS